jgi:regulator of replication initiation timing
MSNDDTYGFELSEDSLKHVEAGAAAYRAALEINRALRDQLDHVKVELARANTENDQLRIINHDLAEKLSVTEKILHAEIAKSSAYWATIEGVAAQILNVKRRIDPKEAQEIPATTPRLPQDAKNGDGANLPRAFLPARSMTGGSGS